MDQKHRPSNVSMTMDDDPSDRKYGVVPVAHSNHWSPYLTKLYQEGHSIWKQKLATCTLHAKNKSLNLQPMITSTSNTSTLPDMDMNTSESNSNSDAKSLIIEPNQLGEEVQQLRAVTGDARTTSKRITKYERTTLLAKRAYALRNGSPAQVNCGPICDPQIIAMWEYRDKCIPLQIRRFLPNQTYEDWSLSELILDED
jgi:DNA-directed RNA polymerases I, II, and III subunit RPABC2